MGPVQTGGVATETQYDGAGRATLQASGSVIGGTFTVVESTATQYDAGGTLQWASGNTQDVFQPVHCPGQRPDGDSGHQRQ